MNFGKTFIILFLVTVSFSVNAQDDLNKTVHVTTTYDPIISDAEKIELPPKFSDTLFSIKTTYEYSIKPQEIMSNVVLRPISAAKINENEYKDPKWFYAKLGVGYPLRFSGDIYMQNLKPENLSYGLFYNHRSLWAKTDRQDEEKVPVNELNHSMTAYLRKNFEKAALNLNGGFEHHNVIFYGYNPAVAKRSGYKFDKDSLLQTYLSFNFAARVNSLQTKNSPFVYDIKFLFDRFGDNGKNKFSSGRAFAMNENKLGLDLAFGRTLGKSHSVSLNADVNFFIDNLSYNKKFEGYKNIAYNSLYNSLYGLNGTGKNISRNNYIFNIAPQYSFSSENLKLELGVKYAIYRKNYSGTKGNLYPVAGIQYKLAEEFIPFAGINGEMIMNDYKSTVAENPYITPGINIEMKPTNCAYSIRIGAKGNVENIFAYNVYGKYSLINDYYFYKNSDNHINFITLGNNFDAVYDDVQQLKLGADMKILAGPVSATMSVAYFSYILDRLKAAFYCPDLIGSLVIEAAVTKSFKIGFNANVNTKYPYFYSAATEETFYEDSYFCMGLSAEYLCNRDFSIFINADNILNNKAGFWHGYNTVGLGIMGGITFKF
ncbi:MAG: TonB-dependent receptor [Prevotellaceae bacterium]|jgi:hypothetical protein|nr:TonB-dependent receptor [Prevotellaceae bacterium]